MKINSARREYADFLTETTENNRLFFELLGVGNETYCRYLWVRRVIDNEPDHVNKWLTLGKVRKGTGDLTSRSDIFDAVASEMPGNDTVDYFLSPNEFFGWRCVKGVSRLHANYIDIDTTQKGQLSEWDQQALIKEVYDRLSESSIAFPNAVIKSGGGGLHLYWIYEPTEAYKWKVEYWKAFTQKVIDALGGGDSWKVDVQASLDPSRVLRLPGSRHNKSKKQVKAYVLGSERFEFESLYKTADITPTRPNHLTLVHDQKTDVSDSEKQPTKRKLTKSQLKVYQQNGKHNIRTWWANIYEQVRHTCSTLGVKEGQRDYAAFILFVARYNTLESKEDAFEKIKADNEAFIHLSEKELTSFLSSAKTKQYKYKRDTLAAYLENNLNMDTSFLYSKSDVKVRLTPAEIKEKQSDAALKTASKKRQGTIQTLTDAYLLVAKMNHKVSVQDLVKHTNVSRRTVYRYWRDITNNGSAIRSASI